MDDPYFAPKTGVLKNKLGITDADELFKAEEKVTAIRISEIDKNPIEGNFDLAHLQKIHKKLFCDIYPWAGQLRKIDISKGGTLFAHNGRIVPEMNKLAIQLKNEHFLTGTDREQFVDRAGYFLSEINVIHPFREGNGPTQRAFWDQLAKINNFKIQWDKTSKENMIKASIESYLGTYKQLSKLIGSCLAPMKVEV